MKQLKKNLYSYFEDDDDMEMLPKSNNSHCALLITLYKAMNDLHITHNVQTSKDKSIHEAIGGLYTAIDDRLDRFVETVFGIYGPSSISFSSGPILTDIVSYCKSLYGKIESERKMYKESWIQNMIDNFQEDIAMTLYQLQYVKSEP